jgi:hypothetical protein
LKPRLERNGAEKISSIHINEAANVRLKIILVILDMLIHFHRFVCIKSYECLIIIPELIRGKQPEE